MGQDNFQSYQKQQDMYYNTRQVNPISLLQSGIPEILDPSNIPPDIRPTIYERMNYLQRTNQYQTPHNNPSLLRYLLDLTEPAAASPRFWADSAGRHAGDGHSTAGGSVDMVRVRIDLARRSAPTTRTPLLAWLGIGNLGGTRGVKES
jgi:hypothetical protein